MIWPELGPFLAASALLTLAPGPDNTFVVAMGLAHGRRSAIWTAMGMCAGNSIHTAVVAAGLAGMLYKWPVSLLFLKYAGAVYLCYLAVAMWRSTGPSAGRPVQTAPAVRLFRRGFLMNTLNPKVGLFFLAFLPTFVRGTEHVALQVVVLGAVFIAQAVVLFGLIGWFSGQLGARLKRNDRLALAMNRLTAILLVGLAIRLITA